MGDNGGDRPSQHPELDTPTHHQQAASRVSANVMAPWSSRHSATATASPGRISCPAAQKKLALIVTIRRWGGSHNSRPKEKQRERMSGKGGEEPSRWGCFGRDEMHRVSLGASELPASATNREGGHEVVQQHRRATCFPKVPRRSGASTNPHGSHSDHQEVAFQGSSSSPGKPQTRVCPSRGGIG